MKAIGMWYFTLILINLIYYSISRLHGKCGYPGKPYKAKLEPDKLEYSEGERVTYQCIEYKWFIETRICEKGRWTGKQPRCGNSVEGILMKDVRVEDISTPDNPILMFEHLNMTIDDSETRRAFTHHRFKKARLRIFDSKRYRWTIKFTAPFHKLLVRNSFNFINYTHLTAEQMQNLTFNISVYVSPERKCVLDHQIHDDWRENGKRTKNYFTCDSLSLDAYKRDVENPSDYMIMETQSSVDLPHDLIALSFGKSYGNLEQPLCGEPEISVGQISKPIRQYNSYSISCKNKETWLQVSKHNHIIADNSIHGLKCVADMKWNGSYPECIPLKSCPIDKLLTDPNSSQIVINSLDGLYFSNDTEYHTYEGTQAHYGCVNPNSSLIGKESRTCLKNGSWSNTEPHCYDPDEGRKFSSSTVIGILGGTLTFVIILTAVMLYVYIKRMKTKMNKQITSQRRPGSGGVEVYDDINVLSDLRCKDDIYDTYDVIGEEQEVRYADAYYAVGQDYVEMPHIENAMQSSDDYWRIPTSEPTYLEMTTSPRGSLEINVKYKL